MIPVEQLVLGAAILLLVSIAASKISARFGIPALLLFLLVGVLAGSEGIGGIYFDDARLAQAVGVIALAFILFSGGLNANWHHLSPILGEGLRLATAGVLITAVVIALTAHFIFGVSILEGLLFGAIMAPTDAAAVFSLLRGGLKSNLKPLLELESGSNDPMAIFLTIGTIELLTHAGTGPAEIALLFAEEMVLGALIGYGLGRLAVTAINRLNLEFDGLYPVFTLALVLLVYGLTTVVGGNAFLAVYLAGLVLGNRDFIHKRSLVRFHDGLAWLMQIVMFLVLGLLVFPSRVIAVAPQGLLIAAVLIFIARPLSVFVSLIGTKLGGREKLFLSWVGLRGAAPIVLATFPMLAGIADAQVIFDLVFFVVLTSVLLQGTTLSLMARLLKLDSTEAERTPVPLELEQTPDLRNALAEYVVPPGRGAAGMRVFNLGLPPNSLIVLIGRGDNFFIPDGGTLIQPGDKLLVLAEKNALDEISKRLSEQEAS